MDPTENKDYEKLIKRPGLSQHQLRDAAAFTNHKYPNLGLSLEQEDLGEITAGSAVIINVTIEREIDEDVAEPNTQGHAPFYPAEKSESLWLVVAEESTKNLLAIKRITIWKRLQTELDYVVPTPGKHELTLYLMSDSYVGVDQAPTCEVEAAEGMEEEKDEEKDGE